MIRILVTLSFLIVVESWLLATKRPGGADGPREPLSTAGTRESKGYRLILSLPKSSFESDDAIPIDFEVSNDSGRAVVMGECGLWKNHTIEVRDDHGQPPPLTELGDRFRREFAPGTPRDEFRQIRLKPGERHRCTPGRSATNDLSILFRLKPGKYRVRVTHDDRRPPGVLRCSSDWVDFEVRSPRTVPTLELSLRRPPMRLMPPRTSFRRGEPITLDLVLFNASKRKGSIADLSRYLRLEPGGYRVRLTYEDRDELGLYMRTCVSDWIDFRVE